MSWRGGRGGSLGLTARHGPAFLRSHGASNGMALLLLNHTAMAVWISQALLHSLRFSFLRPSSSVELREQLAS